MSAEVLASSDFHHERVSRFFLNKYLIAKIYIYLGPIDALKLSCVSKVWSEALDYIWEETLRYKQNQRLNFIIGPRLTNHFDIKNHIEMKLLREFSLRAYKCSSLHLKTIDAEQIAEQELHGSSSSGRILILNGSRDADNTDGCIAFHDIVDKVSSPNAVGKRVIQSTMPTNLPGSIIAMGGCSNNNGFVAITGGWNGTSASDRVYMMDYHETTGYTDSFGLGNLWRLCPEFTLPQPLAYNSCTLTSAGDLVVVGGSDGLYQNAEVYKKCYKLSSERIRSMMYPGSNTFCADHVGWSTSVCHHNSNLNTCGYSVEIGSSLNSSWTPFADMKQDRAGHVVMTQCDGVSLIAVGGYGGGMDYWNTIECYDAVRDEWRLCEARMSAGRSGLGACAGASGVGGDNFHVIGSSPLSTCVYAMGGSDDGLRGLKSCEFYDTRTDAWTPMCSMHYSRCYTSACFGASPYYIYISGGVDSVRYVNNVEIYDIRMDRWVVQPMSTAVSSLDSNAFLAWGRFHQNPLANTIPPLSDTTDDIDANDIWNYNAKHELCRADHQMLFIL